MTVGLPKDIAEWAALLGALAFVVTASQRKGLSSWGSPFVFRTACAIGAALFSGLYVAFYLRGGPRIVDATTYYLQGRALSEGHLNWEVGDVPASTMGRFLVRDTLGSGAHASGIFPPGYPVLLALGFLIRAPMAIGPALAFVLVLLTFDLAKQAADFLPAISESDREAVPRVAALLSVVCAVQRYHTADTMSHGLAAVCLTGALACAFRLKRRPIDSNDRAWLGPALGLGLSLGWLVATRPVSGVASASLVVFVLGRRLVSAKIVLAALAAATAPLALLIVQQHAATGAWLTSSQSLYYAVSDGPTGCFAFGFGPGVGCRIEHGDFVAHNLPSGYGANAALATTLRRLKMHLGDPLNAAPLAVVVALAIGWCARIRALRALSLSLPVFAIAYAPFYFDGNYPGAGARFFADQLPIEHVLVALLLSLASARFARSSPRSFFVRERAFGVSVIACALLGFAFSGGSEHALLRDREGGRPMFEPSELASAGVRRGLVFVDTDHGFALGFDPDASPDRGVAVARLRGDATDRFLWEERGKPPAYRYVYSFDPSPVRRVSIVAYEPAPVERLEAEGLWPAMSQDGGYVVPSFHPCASSGRWLRFEPDTGARGLGARLSLPRQLSGKRIRPRIAASVDARVDLRLEVDGASIRTWTDTDRIEPADRGACAGWVFDLAAASVPENAHTIELVFGGEPRLPDPTNGGATPGAHEFLVAFDALRVEENR